MNDQEIVKEKYKKQIEEAVKELKTPGKRHRQIPNILTASRLLAPVLIIPSAITNNFPLTIILSIIFGLTDVVDGAIARKFKLQSELGKTLDAVTDKVYVGTLLIASSFINPILIINLIMELLISSINAKEELKGNSASSTLTGKTKTWFLFLLSSLGIIALKLDISKIITGLSLTTSLLQLITINSYKEKYKGENKKKTKNDDITEELKIKELTENQEKEKVKDTDKSDDQKNKLNNKASINELKQLKELLIQPEEKEEINQYQKKKNTRI